MWELGVIYVADLCPWYIAGLPIGLYPDYGHHHVLCSHIHGWHSQHGHLVLLDKGEQRMYGCVILKYMICLF